MLEVDIRSKRYRAADGGMVEAIGGLGFSVGRGRFTCLVGPSGSGKTTALRLILGLDTEFDGDIRFSGDGDGDGAAKAGEGAAGQPGDAGDLTGGSGAGAGDRAGGAAGPPGKGGGGGPAGLAIAAMFQEPRLMPWRSVDDNIRLALPASLAGRDLGALYAGLELDGLESRFPGELSVGLARRVALARALATEPGLLLLDEPFVSLDEALAARLRTLLAAILAARLDTPRPLAVLMVTHNLAEAVELADEIVLISPRPGRLAGTFRIDTPRNRRDAATRASLLADLHARFPDLS